MDTFLRKHNVDVGKAFGILVLAAMVNETYQMLFDILFADKWMLNLGIIILFFLGRGLYHHSNAARQWTMVLLWTCVVLGVVILVAAAFLRDEIKAPFWKILLAAAAMVPLFWVSISALMSKKAREEFGVVEPCDQADHQ